MFCSSMFSATVSYHSFDKRVLVKRIYGLSAVTVILIKWLVLAAFLLFFFLTRKIVFEILLPY